MKCLLLRICPSWPKLLDRVTSGPFINFFEIDRFPVSLLVLCRRVKVRQAVFSVPGLVEEEMAVVSGLF